MPTKRREPDPEALVRDLVEVAGAGGYTEIDRYRDFRDTFTGSDAGKRVLHQILTWAHIWTSSMAPTAQEMAFAEGERNLGLKILAAVEVEPAAKPQRTRRTKPTGDADG